MSSMRLFMFVLMTSVTIHAFGQTNRSSSTSSNGGGICVTEARWANGDRNLVYSRQSQLPIAMTLLTYVSKGSACRDTEIRLTATFLNEANESICTGIIPQALTSAAEVQMFNLEIRPLAQQDFLRWRMSAATFVLWLVFSGQDYWLATAGLIALLISLLIGGLVLLVLGIWDLIRDFRRFLHARSHKDGHVPL